MNTGRMASHFEGETALKKTTKGAGRVFFWGPVSWQPKITYECFLKWWYPQNTSKWPFLVGKPMVVGETHHLGNPHIILDEPISCHSSFTKDPGLMAAIIVTKPEDGLISFSSEKKNGDVWEAHRLRCLGTQNEQRRKYRTILGRGKETLGGNCKASRWFLVVRGDGGCLLSNCPTVWLSANHHRSSQAHPCHQQCSKDAPDDPPPVITHPYRLEVRSSYGWHKLFGGNKESHASLHSHHLLSFCPENFGQLGASPPAWDDEPLHPSQHGLIWYPGSGRLAQLFLEDRLPSKAKVDFKQKATKVT